MKSVAIFGIGVRFFQHYASEIENKYNIICLADNDKEKQGRIVYGKKVLNLQELLQETFDYVLVIPHMHKMEIMQELLQAGVEQDKIVPWVPEGARSWRRKELLFQGNKCMCRFDDIRFICQTSADFLCMDEIFIHNSYGFFLGNEKGIAIDIGMNCGLASLFLASQDTIEKVYSFEPFPETYQKAKKNIEMNDSSIKEKIIAYNLALSNYDAEKVLPYNLEFAGGMNILSDSSSDSGVHIVIQDAGKRIGKIIEQHPGVPIIIKIDTEGSEYDIIESMQNANLLEQVSIFMIETHMGRENIIKHILQKHNFIYFDHSDCEGLGMIYAVNRNIRR